MKPSSWTRLTTGFPPSYSHPNGYEVHHCGHQTANYPYYLVTPAGLMVVSHNGHGFVRAAWAQEVAEGLASGRFTATNDGCVRPSLLRVLDATMLGPMPDFLLPPSCGDGPDEGATGPPPAEPTPRGCRRALAPRTR